MEKEHVAEVLGTLRRSKSIAKKRAAEVAKKLEVCILFIRVATVILSFY